MLRSPQTPAMPNKTSEHPFEGLCAGGPYDGKRAGSHVKKIVVPIIIPGEPGISQASYEFNEDIGMWIWTGSKDF